MLIVFHASLFIKVATLASILGVEENAGEGLRRAKGHRKNTIEYFLIIVPVRDSFASGSGRSLVRPSLPTVASRL